MLKLFFGRQATNFRKQFVSRGTPQFNAQTVCLQTGDEFSQTVNCLAKDPPFNAQTVCFPTGDEFSQTVCLAKRPANHRSNCFLADWRRIFADSLSREGPRDRPEFFDISRCFLLRRLSCQRTTKVYLIGRSVGRSVAVQY
jgi:hypothetical protein